MAVRNAVESNPPVIGSGTRDVRIVTWSGLLNGDYGAAVAIPAYADRSIQVLGTLGVGGNVRVHGTNKAAPDETADADWAVLTDPQGNDLNLAALKIESVTEPVLWIRPKVTAGDGTTAFTVILVLRK